MSVDGSLTTYEVSLGCLCRSLVQSGYILLDLLHLVLSHKYPQNPKYILTFGSSHQISSYLQACFSKKEKWGGNSKNSHSSKATV